MTRLRFLLPVLVSALLVSRADAVIKKLTPLKDVLEATPVIVTAEVEKVDPARPSMTLKIRETLKGKAEYESLPINLTGDSFAKKDQHSQVMLDRLSPGRKLVLFASCEGKTHTVFGYMEGTWFQVQGIADADTKTIRWAFLHCEPYFRRTFKGTTAELQAVVQKVLEGKAEPPAPDEKAPAGYGPLPEKQSRSTQSPTLFAVIPTFVLIGPLAVIAAFFPGLFATMALAMKRWRAFLTIASINSTLALLYYWLRNYLPDSPALGLNAFSAYLVLLSLGGLLWSGYRYRRLAVGQPTLTHPLDRRATLTTLGITGLLTVTLMIGTLFSWGIASLWEMPFREFTGIAVGLILASGYELYRKATRKLDSQEQPIRLSLSTESMALIGMILFALVNICVSATRSHAGSESVSPATPVSVQTGDCADEHSDNCPKLTRTDTILLEEAQEVFSGITSAPDGHRYFGLLHQTGFRQSGTVICLDSQGKVRWRFNNDGDLKPVYCTPTLVGDRLYVGEGLHTDADRRLFALDAATGKAIWNAPTTSHTEGAAAVTEKAVIFSAGDDGLICVDPANGKKRWQVPGLSQKLHVDNPPVIAGNRVFFGSGYNTLALLAADLETGKELWRTQTKLRSFGKPVVRGDRVYYGLGTGNLVDDLSTEMEPDVPAEKQAAGAIVAVNAATGEIVWQYDLPKSVHTNLAADQRSLYACCKDGSVICLDRKTGKLRWRTTVDQSFAVGPVLASHAHGAVTLGVYVVSLNGTAACLNPATGKPYWIRPLMELTQKRVQVMSQPSLEESPDGRHRRLAIGTMLENRNNGKQSAAVIVIEDEIAD